MNKYVELELDDLLKLLVPHILVPTCMRKLGNWTVEEITHHKDLMRQLQRPLIANDSAGRIVRSNQSVLIAKALSG